MQSEKETRKELIDKQLLQAGWDINDRTAVELEFVVASTIPNQVAETPQHYGGIADYLLKDRRGQAIAVVEAKKTTTDAQRGREQARQYVEQIGQRQGDDPPFCFYTNGTDLYFWDIGHYPPRKLFGYPTRDDLEHWRFLRQHRKPLAGELINTQIAGRDYQLGAIRAVLEGLERARRQFLLVMATGTGKTRTCVALVDTLMRAGWIERTLFLVDRIALRDQALDAFREFLPDEPRWPVNDETDFARDRRVYVATYPTILNLMDRTGSNGNKPYLSPQFFDLIVVDESHRSIYNVYQEVLTYFDGIKLGLTATPTDLIDRNTFSLFGCEDGLPTFAFTLDEAVRHVPPYLCNFQVLALQTRFQQEGMNQQTVSLDDQRHLIQEGKDIAEVNYEGSDLERVVTNRGTNTLLVREFMESCIKDPNGLPGKTIFFCISKAHARRVEAIFDALYPEFRGELARVIVSDDPRVYGKSGLLAQFKDTDFPRIAISVDMLDTGIDVRELVNLVFAKPVFSYTKFWQMIGRGTRLLDPTKPKPWCTAKDTFLVIDCWNNFAYFKIEPEGRPLPASVPLPVRLFGLRLDALEEAIDRGLTETAEAELLRLRELVNGLPAGSVVVREARLALEPLQADPFWQRPTTDRIAHLRQQIQPLMRTLSGVDYKAMRFEKDVVETSLALLRGETERYETLRDGLVAEIAELPLSVNTVADEEALIRRAQTSAFWNTITTDGFQTLIARLGPLMRYATPGTGGGATLTTYNFRDVLVQKEYIQFGPERESVGLAQYRQMVEERVRSLTAFNPYLQKLQRGLPLTEAEIGALADQLEDDKPHVTLDNLRRVYQNRKASFEQFMRHILGLERLETFPQAVAAAFDGFMQAHSGLSSRQLQFLDVLKTYLLEKGEVQKKDLIHAPFTGLHPQGVRGLFSTPQIDELVQLTQSIAA